MFISNAEQFKEKAFNLIQKSSKCNNVTRNLLSRLFAIYQSSNKAYSELINEADKIITTDSVDINHNAYICISDCFASMNAVTVKI